MLSVNSNLKIVRASALYDLVVTGAFMTPWTATWVHGGFTNLSAALALDRPIPALDATTLLFVNLLGSVVVVWSLWRLMRPSRIVGLYDVLARLLFTTWQLYAVAQGASVLILGFTLFEILFAVAQALPLTQGGKATTSARFAG